MHGTTGSQQQVSWAYRGSQRSEQDQSQLKHKRHVNDGSYKGAESCLGLVTGMLAIWEGFIPRSSNLGGVGEGGL